MMFSSKNAQMHNINKRPTLINIFTAPVQNLVHPRPARYGDGKGGKRLVRRLSRGANASQPEPVSHRVRLPLQHKSRLRRPTSLVVPVTSAFLAKCLCETAGRQTPRRTDCRFLPASSAH